MILFYLYLPVVKRCCGDGDDYDADCCL